MYEENEGLKTLLKRTGEGEGDEGLTRLKAENAALQKSLQSVCVCVCVCV